MSHSLLWRYIVLRKSVFIQANVECYLPLDQYNDDILKKYRYVRL